MEPNGTMTVYGLFPYKKYGPADAVKNTKARALFKVSTKATLNQVKTGNFNSGEDQKPDGILRIKSNKKSDLRAKDVMKKEMDANKGYQGQSRNCSTFAREGVKVGTGDDDISGEEGNVVTPNQLYKDTKMEDNVKVEVDPGNLVDTSIIKYSTNDFSKGK